jgi:hypothetical protein
LLADGIDRQLAVRGNGPRRPFAGRRARRTRRIERRGPQMSRVGIEPEDDLRGARGDEAGEPVAEPLDSRRGGKRRTRVG